MLLKQGRNNPALRGPLLGRQPLALGHAARLEHLLYQPQHPPVRDPLGQPSVSSFS